MPNLSDPVLSDAVAGPASVGWAGPAADAPPLLGLLERAGDAGCWRLAGEPAQLQWSPRLAQLLHWPPGSLPSWQHPLDFLAPESQAEVQRLWDGLAPGQAQACEALALTAHGTRLDVRLWVQCQPCGAGTDWLGVVQDISAPKRLERDSQRVMVQLSATLASMTEAFATLDREGRFTYVNDETSQLLQRTAPQLLGRRIWREMDDQGTGRLRAQVQAALAQSRSVEFEEFYLPQHKWMELRLYPYSEGLAVYFHDVSERRREQEELLLLKTSISRLNDVVVIAEATAQRGARIVFANDAFTRLTGYTLAEVLGRNPRLLEGPLTQRGEVMRIRQALRRWEPVHAELIHHKKNGEMFWME